MSARNNVLVYVTLIAIWVVLLVLKTLAHANPATPALLVSAVDSLVGLPITVLVVVFLVRLFLDNRDRRAKRLQLMHIKSCMFRLEMRNLFIANFLALKSPQITISKIKGASEDELRRMREKANTVEYISLEAMEPVIAEYANAYPVWRNFMNIAQQYGFEDIFQDMLYIIHFVSDVRTFKDVNPDKLFVHEAAKNEILMQKVMKVLGDGIRKYLDYAIELKERQPLLFNEVISDYELSALIRSQ